MPRNPPRPGTGSTVASFSSASDFYDDAQNQSTTHSSSSPPPAPSTGASRTGNNPRSSTSSNSGSGSGSNSGSSPANRTTRRSSQRIGKSFEALLASNETWVLKETVDLADDPSNSQMQPPSSSSGGSTGTFGGGPGGMTRSSSSNSTGMSLSLADEVATDGKEDSKKKSSRKLGRKTNSREGGNEQAADNGFTSFIKVLTRKPKWEEEDAEEANREREEMENRRRRAGGNSNSSNYDSMRSISSSSSSRDQQQQQPTSSSSNSLKYQSTSSPSSAQAAFGSNVNVPPGRSSSSSLGGVQTTTMIERSPSSSTRTSSVASTANNHKFATPPEGGASPAGGVILNLPSSESNGSYSNRRRGSDSIERKGSSGDVKGLSTDDRDRRRSYLRAGGTASSPDLKTLVSKKMAQQSSQQQGGSSPIQGSHTWDSPSISSATPTQSQMASSSASSYVQTTKDAPLPSVPNESPALEPTTRSRSSNQSSEKTRLPFPQGSSGAASEEGGSIDSNVTANPINVRQPAKSTGASTSKRGGFGSSTGTTSSSSKPPNLQSSSKSYTSDATNSTTRSKSGGGTISGNAPISLAQESIMSSPSLDSNPTSTSGAFKERMKKTSGFLKKLGGGGGGGSSSSREREKSASKNINSLPAPPTPTATNYASSVKSGVSSSTNTISKKASQASLAAAAAASSSEQDSSNNNSNLMRNQDIAPVPTIPAQYVSEKPGSSIPPPPVRGQKSASRKEKERKNPTTEGMGLGIGMGVPSSSSQSLGRSPSTPLSASTSTSTSVPPRSSSTQIPTSNNEKSQDSAISTHIRKVSSAAGGSDSSGGELRSALKAWESEMDETLKESAKDLEKKTEFKPRNQWGPSPQLPDLGLDIDLDDVRDGEDGRERRQRSRSFMDEDDSSNLTALSSPTSLVASSNSNHTETQTDQNTPSLRSPGLAGGKFPWNRSKSPAGRSSTSERGGGKTSTSSTSTPQVSSPKSYTFEEKDYSSTLSPADVPSRKNSTSPSFPGALPKERISSGSSTSETSASLLNRNGSSNSTSGPGSGFLSRDGGSGSSALVGGRHLSRKETSSIAASLASFETTPETPDSYSKFYTAGSNFAATWAKEKEEEEKREKNRTSVTSEEVETKDSLLRPSEIHQEEDEDDSDLKINPEDSIRLIPRRKGSSNTSGGKSSNEPEEDQQPPTPLDSNFISRDSTLSSSSSKSDLPFITPTESSDRGNLSASALETIAEGSHSRDPSLAQTSAAPPLVYPAPKATSAANPVPGFRKLSLDVNAAPRSSSSSTQGGEISRESSPGPGKTSTSSSAVGPSSIPLHPMERRVSHASVTSLPSNVASPTSRVPSLGVTDMDNLVDNEDESTLEEARELAMKCWNEDESFLKKEKISEWLGGIGKINKIALVIYFSKFDFAGLRVDAAFRKLCDKLFLRAETQQVDRILHAFSQRFWHSNPNSIYGSADVVHSIVFSLLLLNTDLHVADIAERMTRNQFVKNTMSAISDQKLADSFTTSPSIGDDTRSSLSVNVTDHDEKTGSMSPSLSAASGLGGSLSGRSRPSRSGSIRVTRSGSKDPISSGGNNGSTPNLASTNNNGSSRSFSASTDEISSPPLSATRSPGKSSAPPSAAFNSSTRGRNAGASVDIDRSKYNTTSKSWEAELEMLLKDIYVAVKGDQIRLPSSDRLLSPALASQRRTAKAGGPGTDRVSALKRGSIRGIQGLLGNNSFPSEDALSQTSSIGSRSLGDSWAFQTTGSSSTSPSVGSSLHPPTLGFANTLSHSIIKESQDEDVARSINSEQEEVDDDELALMGPPWAKEGVLTRKHYWDAPQKRAKDKAWVEVFVVVQKGTLSMFKFGSDSSSSKASAGSSAPVGGGNWLSNATSLGEVPLAHALANALPPPGYNRSRPHVLALTLPGGAVYFFQAGHEDLVHEWVSTCNYWAARQSREPLAAGVSNMEYGWNKVLPSQYDDEEDLDEREETTSIVSGFSSPPDGSIYNAPITPHGPKASDTRSIRSGKSTSARSMRARGAALYQNWHEAASLVTPGGGQSKDKDNGSIYGAGAASIMSSPGTSMMSGGGVGSHANERTFINEWKPPVSTTVPSTLKEEEQLDRCISQVTRIEEELTAHTNLRQPMLGLYGPRSSNGAKALSNWERKSNYLLQELVKYQCYVESLKGAVRMRAEKRGKREVDALLEQADDEMSRVRQDEEGGPVKV